MYNQGRTISADDVNAITAHFGALGMGASLAESVIRLTTKVTMTANGANAMPISASNGAANM